MSNPSVCISRQKILILCLAMLCIWKWSLDFSAFNEHDHSASRLLDCEEMNKLVSINGCFAPIKPQNPGVLFATQIFAYMLFLLVWLLLQISALSWVSRPPCGPKGPSTAEALRGSKQAERASEGEVPLPFNYLQTNILKKWPL